MFAALQTTVATLRSTNDQAEMRVRELEHETHSLRTGRVHPQWVVDDLEHQLQQVETVREKESHSHAVSVSSLEAQIASLGAELATANATIQAAALREEQMQAVRDVGVCGSVGARES